MRIETLAGDSFNEVAEMAKLLATVRGGETSEFDFNGVTCFVGALTNTEWLYRDYCNAFLMGWDTVGPDCVEEYSQEVKDELNKRRSEQEKRHKAYKRKQARIRAADKAVFEKKVEDVEITLKDEDLWGKSIAANPEGYGKAIIDYAEGWAKLMQIEIAAGRSLSECYESTQQQVDFIGISGAQFWAAANLLAQVWVYGEELKELLTTKYN